MKRTISNPYEAERINLIHQHVDLPRYTDRLSLNIRVRGNENRDQRSIKLAFGIGKAYKKKLEKICATIVFGLLAAPMNRMKVE